MITGQHPGITSVEAPGIASLAVRDLLHGPHQAGRVLAVVQGTIIAEFPAARREPRVIAISAPDAIRLPNAIIATIPSALTTAVTSGAQSSSAAKDTHGSNSGRSASVASASRGWGGGNGGGGGPARGGHGGTGGGSGSGLGGTGAGSASGSGKVTGHGVSGSGSGAGHGGSGAASGGGAGSGAEHGGNGPGSGASGGGVALGVSRNGHLIGAGGIIHVGRGAVHIGGLTVHARRWWDPSPVLGPLSRGRLDQGAAVLSQACRQAIPGPALRDHEGPKALAASCAVGDLAGAVEQAERLVGLGAGIVPGGDSVLCGLLLALRLLGGAIPGGTRAVWLADWLSAAVTSYASERTTPLAASLLCCAARGQAPAEVAAVLRGVAGEDPVEPAARRLLAARTAVALGTADLAWGLVAGCRAAQALSVS